MASRGVVSRKSEHEVAKSAASATTAYLIRFMIVSILRLEGHGDTQRVGHHERIVRSTFYIGFGIGIHLHAVDGQEIFRQSSSNAFLEMPNTRVTLCGSV